MMINDEAVEAAAKAMGKLVWADYDHETDMDRDEHESNARAALQAAAPIIRAEVLEAAAKDLAQLAYVRPDAPGRKEYERLLAVRRGNTDAWLKERAAAMPGPPKCDPSTGAHSTPHIGCILR